MNAYSCGSSHMMKENKLMVVSVRSAMVSRFLKIVQVTVKCDPFDAM